MIQVKLSPRTGLMLVLAVSLPICSCASIVTGSEDTVKIQSAPVGASFTTNTGAVGTTPQVSRCRTTLFSKSTTPCPVTKMPTSHFLRE